MEGKAIIYIIGGILYFAYTLAKKAQEKKAEAQRKAVGTAPPPTPISPPAYKPLNDAMEELRRKQAAQEPLKKAPVMQSRPVQKPKPQPKRKEESLLREMKTAGEIEGKENSESANVKRKAIADEKKEMEAIYESQDDKATVGSGYEFDARQAFIGSLIFERKY